MSLGALIGSRLHSVINFVSTFPVSKFNCAAAARPEGRKSGRWRGGYGCGVVVVEQART